MSIFDPSKLLSYGAIGLGFLLAFLAYRLLSDEGKREPYPRKEMVRAIYAFMVFAFLLSFLGFSSELAKSLYVPKSLASAPNTKPVDMQSSDTKPLEPKVSTSTVVPAKKVVAARVVKSVDFTLLTPVLKSPIIGSELDSFPREITFEWAEVPGAVAYKVQAEILKPLDPSTHASIWVPIWQTQVTTTMKHDQWSGGGQYHWRVIAIDEKGRTSQPSDWWTFSFRS
ncbi:hypothetical protein [Acidicapsa ligni]|uniref:hypothetical protein n=1 Tax=Acidicapsa ligni TaxID=542300 RepID=UPI0021DFAC9D|nr:hypothetical protein [Acidicapsa ligni]